MKETIILVNELNNTELSRSLALRGVASFNTRIMGATEFAKYVLMRAGIVVEKEFISTKKATAMVAELISEIPYFSKANYGDVANAVRAMNSVRSLIIKDEKRQFADIFVKGIFEEKNQSLITLYERYMEKCEQDGLIDSIMLMRKAIAEGKPINATFIKLEEFSLSPLEEHMLYVASKGQEVVEKSIISLYGQEPKKTKITRYANNYGTPNEVEYIVSDIYSREENLDQNVVAVCDLRSYNQNFFELSMLYDIPMTFGTGLAISNSFPGKLLNLYYHWKTDGYFGVDALLKMCESDFFSRHTLKKMLPEGIHFRPLLEKCGKLRLGDNKEKNISLVQGCMEEGMSEDIQKALLVMADNLALPVEEFVRRFSRIRFVEKKAGELTDAQALVCKLDGTATKVIFDSLVGFRETEAMQKVDFIPQLLSQNICKEQSRAGAIHITSVAGAFSVARDNLYIAGLSAKKYPGAPKENYLILDEDYRLFKDGEKYISSAKVMNKREMLLNLVSFFSSLKSNIFVSYAGLNVSDLKNENASSLLFELYRAEHGQDATFEEMEKQVEMIGYFEPTISKTREIGKAYNQGYSVERSASADTTAQVVNYELPVDKDYSPSAAGTFFTCGKRFLLKYIMHVREPKDFDNLSIISAADEGTLAHLVMEKTVLTNATKKRYLEIAGEVFDEYLKNNQALIESDGKEAKKSFVDMMKKSYDFRPDGQIELVEDEISCVHKETGLHFKGRPDCVIKKNINGQEKYVVIDYKTNQQMSHEKDDVESCLQTLLYAYMLEQSGKVVDHCEYRYLRLGETVTCKYDSEIKKNLSEMLKRFKDTLNRDKALEGKDNPACNYCKYGEICKMIV